MHILSLDLSLRATGVCECDGSTGVLVCRHTGMKRLLWIRDKVMDLAFMNKPGLVVIENYSFGSQGRATVSIGELGGVVRLALFEARIPVVEIPPTCLKKYATGRGNAGKDDVLQAGVMRAGHTFADNNACDAWWLWCMAMAHYCPGDPRVPHMPKSNLAALDKIEWVEARAL